MIAQRAKSLWDEDCIGVPSLCHILAADLHRANSKGVSVLRDADCAQILCAEVPQTPLRCNKALQEKIGSPKHL